MRERELRPNVDGWYTEAERKRPPPGLPSSKSGSGEEMRREKERTAGLARPLWDWVWKKAEKAIVVH